MPAQSNRGIAVIWFRGGHNRPKASGVRKVFLRTNSPKPYAYAYYDRKDDCWYDANGDRVYNVVSYLELSA